MKKARFKLPIDPLEGWSAVAGLIVFIGLGFEIGPEAWGYFITWYQPPRELFGSALVVIAVFAEVAIGIFIARSSKREQIKSEAAISAANERAAKAEQLAAESNLARVKLEQRMKPRMILGPESESLKALLSPHAGKWVDIMLFDQHLLETTNFAWQFLSLFKSANWNVRMFEHIGAQHRISGAPLVVAIGIDAPNDLLELAVELLETFKKLEIECHVAPRGFGEVNKPWPLNGPFRLVKEEPLRIFGVKAVSPFRIQIGALQLVPAPPMRLIIGKIGPPPKA
jgi:hypothetical protein